MKNKEYYHQTIDKTYVERNNSIAIAIMHGLMDLYDAQAYDHLKIVKEFAKNLDYDKEG